LRCYPYAQSHLVYNVCLCHPTDTDIAKIEEAFTTLTNREDIAIVLINQHVANEIRHILKDYDKTIPTVLEIPSKDTPYDPEQDYIMQRINLMLGGAST
jgi:V-type H+-transporting ATPase subunit F